MNFQRAAAIVFAACVGVAPGASAHVAKHDAHHVRHAHHPVRHAHTHHVAARHVAAHEALAHTAVMNAGEISESNLTVDGTATVNGIEMGCTGIGIDTREDPRWASFPVRVEFSGAYSQYIPGGQLVVKDENRKPLLNVRCDAPWVLLRLEPGKYRMAGVMVGYSQPQSWVMQLKANRTRPRRIVFHFDEVNGSTP